MRLYELTENYKQVWAMVEEPDTDLTVIEDTLSSLEGAIEEKAVNIMQFVQSLEADANIIKAEEKRLSDRRKAMENRAKSISKYLQRQMEAAGLDKIKTPTITLALQNNPPKVEITDESAIPSSYLTIVPEQYIPDKKSIAAAIKSGKEVPGCHLNSSKSLRIR